MRAFQLNILRRARGAMDGPWPVYFVVDGTKIPLSPVQTRFLDGECRWMAKRTDQEMVNFMESFLRVERGQAPFAHILMGLLREEAPAGSQIEGIGGDIPVPDQCDQCAVELAAGGWVVDGITTKQFLWSWMCVRCFVLHGCGVGVGWGQLYRRTASGGWTLVKGDSPASPKQLSTEELGAIFDEELARAFPTDQSPASHHHAAASRHSNDDEIDRAVREFEALFSKENMTTGLGPKSVDDPGSDGAS